MKESGAYSGEYGKAIYAVGVGNPGPDVRMQRTGARIDARAELARQQETYVAELLKMFAQQHRDWFDQEYAGSIEFFSQAAKQVTDATLSGSVPVEWWLDRKGKYGPKGTMYVLMMRRLDDEFFNAAQERAKRLMRQYQEKLIKIKADNAFKELEKELEKARQNPLDVFNVPAPESGEMGSEEDSEE
jgi:hypothetical protein